MQLETILLAQVLQPLQASFGQVSVLPITLLAQAIAQRDAARFSMALKLFA